MIKVYKNNELYSSHTQLVDAMYQVKFALDAGADLSDFRIGEEGEDVEWVDPTAELLEPQE